MSFDRDQKVAEIDCLATSFLSLIDGQTEIYTDTKSYITQTLVICVRKKESMLHTLKETRHIKVKDHVTRNISTTNKVYNSIPRSIQQLIYTRIYTCTCNCIHMYVQHKYVYRIRSLTLIVISHLFPSTYRL